MTRQSFFLIGLTAVVGFLLGLVDAGSRTPGDSRSSLAYPASAAVSPPPRTVVSPVVSAPAGVDFSVVAARVNGAVVNIDAQSRGTDRLVPNRRYQRESVDDDGSPKEGSGSGFIVDQAGYVLTNHHVVEGADRVTVTLGDGRIFRAAVVGVDPAIDIALLQIPASASLPVAPLGDSDTLRVGEWVCAIGNPLGYVHSVTVGVVSFLDRKLFDPSLDAFIQTDAAISFGNSGGPLINTRGQVVGITTAISSQAPNIGFAVPISQVMAVLPQLKDQGRVSRGYLGVDLTSATPELRKSLRLGPSRGALIEDVMADTPADRAGLRVYDLVTAADEHPILSGEDLDRYISARTPGTVSRLTLWRDNVRHDVPVRLSERPLPRSAAQSSAAGDAVRSGATHEMGPLGLNVKDLDARTIRRLSIPDSMVGVMVTDVDPAGPAQLVKIRPGHVLLEINRRRVASAADYHQVVAALHPGETVGLLLYITRTDQRVIRAVVLDPQ
jgi:serine protease Do